MSAKAQETRYGDCGGDRCEGAERRDFALHGAQCSELRRGGALGARAAHPAPNARLMRRGVLVETGEDTYFLDVPAYDRWRRSLRLRTVVLLAGVAVVGAAFAALA